MLHLSVPAIALGAAANFSEYHVGFSEARKPPTFSDGVSLSRGTRTAGYLPNATTQYGYQRRRYGKGSRTRLW